MNIAAWSCFTSFITDKEGHSFEAQNGTALIHISICAADRVSTLSTPRFIHPQPVSDGLTGPSLCRGRKLGRPFLQAGHSFRISRFLAADCGTPVTLSVGR